MQQAGIGTRWAQQRGKDLFRGRRIAGAQDLVGLG
jgi:hypothetical protein